MGWGASPATALAGQALTIEIERLAANTGKLAPYSTAVGGLLCMRFDSDETATRRPIEATAQGLVATR